MNKSKPVRAFHLRFGSHDLVDDFKVFIETVLAPKSINHLVLECNTDFVFESHPEVTGGTLTKEDAKEIAAVCKENGIRLIPLMQCLGHQGWGGGRSSLLKAYPEFDETPHVPEDAEWPAFFAPSWCPLHPDVNGVVFDLMDELLDAFDADAFHVGMDEVFALADDQCPRCSGKDRGELFAKAVQDMYGHLVETREVEMFMWGDRLNSSEATGYNEWEGDTFGTSSAIDHIPKDIVIMDWHYEKLEAYPSIGIFIDKGFTVIPACWFDTEAAVDLLNESKRQAEERDAGNRMPGMLITSWHGWDKASFDKFNHMKPNTFKPDDALEELEELYRTLDVITHQLK
ncbi:family 20 glycosylhydrolase [Lentibacillus sp. JNUCC-1]|uniref:family 20 glycosylhydrolase n=1 Tax=Lentibacillus sp. JNUCC-1 TaxID=2654513 RepID=UPI0018D1F811|nr:family 20 glycosylhydrolase [Lentibacillus sp. JNUCC-1]